MNQSTRILATIVAIGLSASCKGAQTDRPVVSDADGKASVSPSGDQAARRGRSMVRLVNALPATAGISVSQDDRGLFTAVSYKTVTPYVEIKDNRVTFQLRLASADAAVANNRKLVLDGYRYTIVALPDDEGKPTMHILRDEVVPDAGKARVRVINAVSGAKDVDVAFQGQKDPLFKGVGYASEAGFKDIDPVTATVEIRREGPNAKPILIKNMKFGAGKAYSIVLVGSKTNPVEVITFDDSETGSNLSLK